MQIGHARQQRRLHVVLGQTLCPADRVPVDLKVGPQAHACAACRDETIRQVEQTGLLAGPLGSQGWAAQQSIRRVHPALRGSGLRTPR